MEDNVLKRIEQNILKLTKLQRKVANYILQNPLQAAFSTIDQLAHTVDTSTTTIMRLSLFLGYSGYTEFQKDLQEVLKNSAAPETKLRINLDGGLQQKDNPIQSITQQQLDNISKTVINVSDEQVLEAERMISEARHLFVAGQRSCFSVAHFLSYNLDRIYKKCDLLSTAGGELYEKLSRLQAGDVLIAISLPRYIRKITKIAEFAKNRGVKVIALTDSYLSPLAGFADVLFLAECKSTDFHNSVISSMLIAELMIGLCAVKSPELVKQNLKSSENVLHSFGVHIEK